jgi:hypothetical protein
MSIIFAWGSKINYLKWYDNEQQSSFNWEESIYNHLCVIKPWGQLRVPSRRMRGRCQLYILAKCLASSRKEASNMIMSTIILNCVARRSLLIVLVIHTHTHIQTVSDLMFASPRYFCLLNIIPPVKISMSVYTATSVIWIHYCNITSMFLNLLKSSGNFTHHQV